jgi:hypothetical protein
MIVQQLYQLRDLYDDQLAMDHSRMLFNRKIGFTFDQVYNKKPQILDSIILEALAEANQNLSQTAAVRIPTWISKADYLAFLSKISDQCGSLL